MPNWCWTDCTIVCKSNKDRNIILDELDKVKQDEGIENGFGNLWLGNLLYHIGYPKEDICNGDVCECRGEIEYFDESKDKEVQLGIESAWEPMLKVIRLFANKYISGYKIRYVSEESGCGMYITNQRDVRGKYEVNAYDEDDIQKLGITTAREERSSPPHRQSRPPSRSPSAWRPDPASVSLPF